MATKKTLLAGIAFTTTEPKFEGRSVDPIEHRREILVAGLTLQRDSMQAAADKKSFVPRKEQIVKDAAGKVVMENGKAKKADLPYKMKHYFKQATDGLWFFEPHYGSKVFPINGKKWIAKQTLKELVEQVDVLIEATKAGELDTALASMGRKKKA